MLPKRSRVTTQTIEKHLVRARRIKTSRFLVLYEILAGGARPQISVTVSKKVAPTAVLRNKLRRRGYAALAHLLPHLSKTAVVLVSYNTPDIKTTIAELREELKETFLKIKLYRE